LFVHFFFFFKQKTAYEMRISDWSSDVCSSDLPVNASAIIITPNKKGDPNGPPRRLQNVRQFTPDATSTSYPPICDRPGQCRSRPPVDSPAGCPERPFRN